MSHEMVCDTRESFEDRDELGNKIIDGHEGTPSSLDVDGDRVCVLFQL